MTGEFTIRPAHDGDSDCIPRFIAADNIPIRDEIELEGPLVGKI